MAEELNELRAAIQHELELARSGDGYEEAAVAAEIVERMVAPMLAAREASFDQRLSDVREEYRKSLESWDRSRKRLDSTVEELRTDWREADQQHARDVELLLNAVATRAVDDARAETRVQGELAEKRLVAREDWKARCLSAEASRQAWAEEAMRLDVENSELRDQLREEQIWREDIMHEMAGLNPDRPIAKTARRYRRERDEALEEAGRLKAGGCGCPTESDPDPEAPLLPCGHRTSQQVRSVPQCAVHPEAPDLTDDEPPEVWMEAPDDADYSRAVHPDGDVA